MVKVLAVDIGNTSIGFALLAGKKISTIGTLDVLSSKKVLSKNVNTLLKKHKVQSQVEYVVVCSVVPDKTKFVVKILKATLGVSVNIIGSDIKVPITNKYKNPSQVGQDRLVCAYAVKELYGYPAIIVDFGTAITFDVVSNKGHYEGGLIVPGIRLSIESLFNKTALLPKVQNIKAPCSLVGKTTKDSILSGLVYGYGHMCNGLIQQISSKMSKPPHILLTGGYTTLMKRFISHKRAKIDRNLVFKGLALLCANKNLS